MVWLIVMYGAVLHLAGHLGSTLVGTLSWVGCDLACLGFSTAFRTLGLEAAGRMCKHTPGSCDNSAAYYTSLLQLMYKHLEVLQLTTGVWSQLNTIYLPQHIDTHM